MAFKQPRVPEYRESEGTGKYIRSLVLFLKDFCMDVWTANNQRTGEIDAVRGGLSEMHYPVNSVCGKTGDVTLTAGDVGARPGSWMPTASDVGALAQGGTAADSSKLGGRTWDEHLLDIYPIGSIYMSVHSTSPASLFGGTWEPIHGRFLLASGSPDANTDNWFGDITGGWVAGSGSTGGQDYHTLTVEEMPSHTHESQYVKPQSGYTAAGMMGSTEANWWSVDYIRATGGGQKHNNMPPYLAVNMWKRVS